MRIRPVARWQSFVAVVLALSTAGLMERAVRSQPPQPDPLVALATRLDPKLPGGNVSLLLDASGSMSGRYATVRTAALRFAEGMGPGETLTARAFAASITQPISGKGADARPQLDAGLPREPMAGTGTDLGLALSKALDDLDRVDAAPIQALFVLTDGLHQPLDDSPFSRDFAGDGDWVELRRRAAALARKSQLIVYGLGIGSETDIGVLRQVFPARNVEILSGDAATAGIAMARLQRQLRLVRLKTLLEQDIEQGMVTATPQSSSSRRPDREITVPIVIHNTYQALPVTITGLHVEASPDVSAGTSVRLDAPSSLRLGPDERSTVTLGIRLDRDMPRWALGRRRMELDGNWQPIAEAQFEDHAALSLLRLKSEPTFKADKASVEVGIEYGKPWWLLIALGASAILTAVGWKRRITDMPLVNLKGTIAVQGRPVSPADFGKDRVTVGPETADIPLPEAGATGETIELSTCRDGDYARLALITQGFGVSVNGETVSGERILSEGDVVRLGDAEFAVLDDGRQVACLRRPFWFVAPLLAFLVFVIALFIM